MLERGLVQPTPLSSKASTIGPAVLQEAPTPPCAISQRPGESGFQSSRRFHHAMPGNAEGFCYINDIVIAIKDALRLMPGLKSLTSILTPIMETEWQEGLSRGPEHSRSLCS